MLNQSLRITQCELDLVEINMIFDVRYQGNKHGLDYSGKINSQRKNLVTNA